MQDFSVEWWPVDRPKPYPANPRQIGEYAIEKVAASLREFGWRQLIVVDANEEIIVGQALPGGEAERLFARKPRTSWQWGKDSAAENEARAALTG